MDGYLGYTARYVAGHIKATAAVFIICAVVSILLFLLQDPIYVSRAVVVIRNNGPAQSVSPLNLLSREAADLYLPHDFADDALRSRFVVDGLLDKVWIVGNDSIRLADVIVDGHGRKTIQEYRKIVRRDVLAYVTRNGNADIISCRLPDSPELAMHVANTAVALLDSALYYFTRDQINKHNEYISGQLLDKRRDADRVRNRLVRFLADNRMYETSPKLAAHYRVLKDSLAFYEAQCRDLSRELASNAQKLAMSRYQVYCVDPAELPDKPSYPKLHWYVLLGLMAGAISNLFVSSVAFARYYVKSGDD